MLAIQITFWLFQDVFFKLLIFWLEVFKRVATQYSLGPFRSHTALQNYFRIDGLLILWKLNALIEIKMRSFQIRNYAGLLFLISTFSFVLLSSFAI